MGNNVPTINDTTDLKKEKKVGRLSYNVLTFEVLKED